MKTILLIVTLLFGCSVRVEPEQPSVCVQHSPAEFRSGLLSCEVNTAAKCAFNPHDEPTALDQSEGPVSYVCTCDGDAHYHCWGSPGLTPEVTP